MYYYVICYFSIITLCLSNHKNGLHITALRPITSIMLEHVLTHVAKQLLYNTELENGRVSDLWLLICPTILKIMLTPYRVKCQPFKSTNLINVSAYKCVLLIHVNLIDVSTL